MIGDRDRTGGCWIDGVRGVTSNDRQVGCWEVDRGPRVPGRLTSDQVTVTGLDLRDLLGYQPVGLLIAGVLIVDHPFHPLVLTGGVVLMR